MTSAKPLCAHCNVQVSGPEHLLECITTHGPELEDNAYKQLMNFLKSNEVIEAIKFGYWEGWSDKCVEPDIFHYRNIPMSIDIAKHFMLSWSAERSAYGTDDGSENFNIRIWTNKRVIFIHEYDGLRWLRAIERHPNS